MTTVEKAKTRFIGLRIKLLIGFTLLFTVVFAAAFYWFYNFTSQKTIDRIEVDLRNTLQAAAEGVNAEQLMTLYAEGSPNAEGFSDSPLFAEQIAWLDLVNKIEPRAWPYIYVPSEITGEIVFVVDLYAIYDTSKAAGFRQMYEPITPFMEEGFVNEAINMNPYTDLWGSWVSGYMPIYDEVGNVVAAMGIDFSADYLFQVQQAIRDRVTLAFAITYIVLFLLVLWMSNAFTKPIRELTSAAEVIGEGNYNNYKRNLSSSQKVHFHDEISKLAEVFEIMVGKVKKREESLKKEVVQLKIEIDESKRQKQVDAIVDSDSFQDLKKRAQALRNRRQPTSTVDRDKG